MTVDPKFRARQYEYDANGRQRWTARLDGSEVATALYDGAGQRVETSAGGETRQIIYDAHGQMIAEYVGGVWARDYIYRGGQVIATMEAAGATARYVMSDLQGSARVTMDSSGGIIARHDYLPFGEEIQSGTGLRTTAQGYGAADERRQKYALLERDEETGQDHAWWRKYESTAGRWTTPDPYQGSMSIGDPQSINRYAYVGNDPVNRVDPTGLLWVMNCGFVGSVGGLDGGPRVDIYICTMQYIDTSIMGHRGIVPFGGQLKFLQDKKKKTQKRLPPELVHCIPEVDQAINDIRSAARISSANKEGGGRGFEFGFTVDRNPDSGDYQLGLNKSGGFFTSKSGQEVQIPVRGNTVARIHTHKGQKYPSTGDNSDVENSDKTNTLSYVASQEGWLTLYNPFFPRHPNGDLRLIDAAPCPK